MQGNTVLHMAMGQWDWLPVAFVQLLLDAGADPRRRNSNVSPSSHSLEKAF